MDDRYVERIAALLNKAESTDSEHERDALVAAAQRLAAKHSIDLALAAGRSADRTPQLVVERFEFPVSAQNRNLKKHLVRLMSAVVRSNDVRMDVFSSSSGVILYGYASDVLACTTLWASLSLQMVGAVDSWMRTGEWRSQTMVREGRWGRPEVVPMDARVARSSFYAGYVGRVAERLHVARAAAEADAAADAASAAWDREPGGRVPSTEVMIAAKQERVTGFHAGESRARGAWQGPSSLAGSAGATTAGRSAASRARLGGERVLGGGRGELSA